MLSARSITTPMSCSTRMMLLMPSLKTGVSGISFSLALVDVEDEAGDVFFLFQIHSGHRLVQEQDLGLQSQGPSQFDPLAQAVGQRHPPSVLRMDSISRKSMISSTVCRCLISSRWDQPEIDRSGHEVLLHEDVPGGHDVVLGAEAGVELDVLKGAGDAHLGQLVRPLTGNLRVSSKYISPFWGL